MNRRQFTQQALLATGALGLTPLTRFVAQAQNLPVPPAKNNGAVSTANGVVYGIREGRKFPLPNVAVSNGQEVVSTDRLGRYKLPVQDGDIIFVIKPRGYALPLNEQNMPRFHYIHHPQGSPAQQFPGTAPTGALPQSIDFTLTEQKEPDEFRVILFGDPQSRNQEEVGYLMNDVIEDVAGQKAAFGVSLGDIAFDDLSIYDNQNHAVGLIGIPWYNLAGNHDINYDAPDRTHSMETFKSTFGPTYYSFNYGSAHFVVLDNVAYDGKDSQPGGKHGTYHAELGARQLTWLENDLKVVPKDQLVVLMMHIPIVTPQANGGPENNLRDLPALFRLLENRPHTLSISAHTHFQEHLFLGREVGWNGATEHHHFNCVTTCGSWWGGIKNEQGVPHTTMRDGAPNGYAYLNIKGNSYSIDFKASQRPEEHQMNIYAPIEVPRAEVGKTEVLANIFSGSKKSKVEVQVGGNPWIKMEQVSRPDPAYAACVAYQEGLPKKLARSLPAIIDSPHLWAAPLPANLPAGTHLILVRTTDMWGRTFSDRKILRIV
jgi:hypothetical protein